jgi:hypothetical protein
MLVGSAKVHCVLHASVSTRMRGQGVVATDSVSSQSLTPRRSHVRQLDHATELVSFASQPRSGVHFGELQDVRPLATDEQPTNCCGCLVSVN